MMTFDNFIDFEEVMENQLMNDIEIDLTRGIEMNPEEAIEVAKLQEPRDMSMEERQA
jgi:hypothetical protein